MLATDAIAELAGQPCPPGVHSPAGLTSATGSAVQDQRIRALDAGMAFASPRTGRGDRPKTASRTEHGRCIFSTGLDTARRPPCLAALRSAARAAAGDGNGNVSAGACRDRARKPRRWFRHCCRQITQCRARLRPLHPAAGTRYARECGD